MRIASQKENKRRILIDSSVIIAGILSPSGGSAKILATHKSGLLCFISNAIQDEVNRNINTEQNKQFLNLLRSVPVRIIKINDEELNKFAGFVDDKDVHVITAAKKADCGLIVSLNRKHLVGNARVKSSLGIEIISPKELINLELLAYKKINIMDVG